jgi:hypothetical protein
MKAALPARRRQHKVNIGRIGGEFLLMRFVKGSQSEESKRSEEHPELDSRPAPNVPSS